jgi:hypothetical protein
MTEEERAAVLRRVRLKVTLALAILNFGNGRWWRINELPDATELASLVLEVVESHGELI